MLRIKGVTSVILILLALTSPAAGVFGQDNGPGELEIRLRRYFGYALVGQMQGTFSIIVNSREDLNRVVYILDDNVIGETLSSPHRFSFETKDYPAGSHKLEVIGYTTDGQEIQSNTIVRQFVPGNSVTIIVVVIVGFVILARLVSYLLTKKSSDSGRIGSYGFLGGGICPNCERPFSIHWWSLRLGFARYDRCPHCGKWHLVKRASSERLAEAERRGDKSHTTNDDSLEDQQKDEYEYKKLIDESRYEDS